MSSSGGQSTSQAKGVPHESIVAKELHELRERWHRTPFLRRINALSIFFFCLIAAGYAILLADDVAHHSDQATRSKAYPQVLHGISNVASALSAELEASVAYQKAQQNATTWSTLQSVRDATTAAFTTQRELFQEYQDATIDTDYALLQGTRLSEVGIGSIFNMRSQVVEGQVMLPAQGIRNGLYSVNARVLQQYAKGALSYAKLSPLEAALEAYMTGAIGWHTGLSMAAVTTFNSIGLTSNTSGISTALKSLVVNMQYATTLETYGIMPLISIADRNRLQAMEGASALHNRLQTLLTRTTFGASYNTAQVVSTSASFPAARAALRSMNDQVLAAASTSLDTSFHYERSLAMLIIAAVVVVASGVQWGVVEFVNAERNAIRIHNAHVMHDVLVRVGELVGHMANFSLDPLPPPRSMMGTHVGVLELRLQHCMASLKTLAPALPPLLFPGRLSALAAEYSEVHDPSSIQFSRKLRDSLLKETLHQVTVEDLTLRNPFVGAMQELTELQIHECEAAFVYVDLNSFFDMSTVERMQLSQECFKETAALVEESVYQFKGVLHTISLDRAVGVWNIATQVSNACEQAATCALVLSHRLAVLRRQNRLLSQYFHINIGVVAGLVQYGVFGDGHHKYVGIFGPPISRGIKVARANAAHMTTVAMDEAVRRAVNKIYLAKPIELLDDGACVYEVIHEGSRREADLETQLLVYSKAFELYQKKYYREALRAFRGYTKLYGYDSSVERIQTLITGVQQLPAAA